VSERVSLRGDDQVSVAAAAALALAGTTFAATVGSIGVRVALLCSFFLLVCAAFLYAPHVAVATAIPFFIVLPALKVLVTPLIGGTKDVICIAAAVAAVLLFLGRRAERRSTRLDHFAVVLLALLALLYLADIGGQLSGEGRYGVAWFHGVRLFAEPLSLFLVGASLRRPAKTYRWATGSLVVTAVVVALVGLAQQVLRGPRLAALGYSYGVEIRTVGGHLRSFGTLLEPFSYAAVLLLAITVIVLRRRIGAAGAIALVILLAGLLFSYERTAVVVLLALTGLAIARRGRTRTAGLFLLVALAAAIAFFIAASDAAVTAPVHVRATQYATLNGRTNVWRAALGGDRAAWILGRGVGVVGRASQRAAESFSGAAADSPTLSSGTVVDSGYLAAATDIGFVGLAILLALFVRLGALSWRAARNAVPAGWVALGIVLVMLVDGLTRESFTAFPTAHVGMLMIGLATAAGNQRALNARSKTSS
jgi:O-antigen ligase